MIFALRYTNAIPGVYKHIAGESVVTWGGVRQTYREWDVFRVYFRRSGDLVCPFVVSLR